MARNQSKRLKPATLQADDNCFAALRAMRAYAPVNPAYLVEAINDARREAHSLRQAEAEALAAAAAARARTIAKEWEVHNLLLAAKHQVIAQFGVDSDELQSLGRKKKSDYKKPGRKAVTT
ncbi:MAG TPA: hypothetical protein VGC91_08570 [Pyrinomonadaceae bacterium]|jgi:hypothetical protein